MSIPVILRETDVLIKSQTGSGQCFGFLLLFFCIPSCISGIHHSSSSSAFPAVSLGFTILFLLPSQLYRWSSPFFFFFCLPSYISGVHQSSSSSVFPAISLGFTILLLLLPSQLYLRGSPFFFFFFCLPSCVSGVHHSSSSSVFLAISLEFTILLLLCSQLYLWSSPFFFFCVPSFLKFSRYLHVPKTATSEASECNRYFQATVGNELSDW